MVGRLCCLTDVACRPVIACGKSQFWLSGLGTRQAFENSVELENSKISAVEFAEWRSSPSRHYRQSTSTPSRNELSSPRSPNKHLLLFSLTAQPLYFSHSPRSLSYFLRAIFSIFLAYQTSDIDLLFKLFLYALTSKRYCRRQLTQRGRPASLPTNPS